MCVPSANSISPIANLPRPLSQARTITGRYHRGIRGPTSRIFENNYFARSTKMVWSPLKLETDSQSRTGKEHVENRLKSETEDSKSSKIMERSCKCGERCKRCTDRCKCGTRRVYIRPPMFNYFTDTMH